MKTTEKYVWAVAYINRDQIGRIDKEISKNNQYQGMKALIPMVSVLKKKLKNEEHFDDIPLLFNYGFFKIPLLWAMNLDLINQIKADISCISHWVQDPARTLVRQSRFRPEKGMEFETEEARLSAKYHDKIRHCVCATVRYREIKELMRLAAEESVHSAEDINQLKIGAVVTLMTYPFADMRARVESINLRDKKVNVTLELGIEDDEDEPEEIQFSGKEVTVSFDNIFYSIYNGGYDENHRHDKVANEAQNKKSQI
jgi:hypothetical protein